MLLSLLVASSFLSAPTHAADQRGGLALTGGLGVPLSVPVFDDGPPPLVIMGCGGVDVFLLPPDQRKRGKKKKYKPNNLRGLASFTGCRAEEVELAAGGIGVGGQWGTRFLYATAYVSAGVGAFRYDEGDRRYQVTGLWVRPKAALGVPLSNGMNVELGPSLSHITPLIHTDIGAPSRGEFSNMVTLDLTLIAGNIGPRR